MLSGKDVNDLINVNRPTMINCSCSVLRMRSVCNYPPLEKIYCMLILSIRFFSLNNRDIKQSSHKRGVTVTPGPP